MFIKNYFKKIGKKGIIIRIIEILVILAICGYENNHLVTSYYEYTSEKVEETLDGYRIVQISDLHNANFGIKNQALIKKIIGLSPDMIVITGDIVDSNLTNIDRAIAFVSEAVKICPVYYVTGNHEYWLDEDERALLITGIEAAGAYILNNEFVRVDNGDASFCLVGIDDQSLIGGPLPDIIKTTDGALNVVLAHEPQYITSYAKAGADLILSGHAHGGQFRIPFVGGLVAPDQGFLPEYTEGEHFELDSEMIISRGLGNSIIPVRLFNDPEIVCVDLRNK